MIFTAYLPIYKVALAYQLRRGRAWTPLEHLLLWRLSSQRSTPSALAAEADVPLRLVIEALINMMDAGWLAVSIAGGELHFEATALGAKVAARKSLPPDTRLQKRGMTLLMDRLCSEFIAADDQNVTVVYEDKIPRDGRRLEPRSFKLRLEPGSVLERLDLNENESFEQWLDYRVTSQSFYLQVGLAGGEVTGLPPYASPLLRNTLREILEPFAEGKGPAVSRPELVEAPESMRALEIAGDDLVVGADEHRQELIRVITSAKTLLVIHSCFITGRAVRALLPELIEAARRGVRVELLWGIRSESLDTSGMRDLQDAFAAVDQLPVDLRSKITLTRTETGSHAKVLVADTHGPGGYEVVLGSCNWLSSLFEKVEISIRTREPWIIGELAGLLAALRIPPSGRWDADVHRLVGVRMACASKQPTSKANASAEIILDNEHLEMVRFARNEASDITAGCDLFGRAAEISVFVPLRAADQAAGNIHLMYATRSKGQTSEEEERAVGELRRSGVELVKAPALHGKFLAWDGDHVVITSFNWLATIADPWKPRGAEIGLHIRSDGIAKQLLSRVKSALQGGAGTPQAPDRGSAPSSD